MKPVEVSSILKKYEKTRGGLVAILEEIQNRYGFLPADVLKMVAENTGKSLVDVYGAATFYRAFSLKPRGEHLVCVCLGTACHVRGAQTVKEEFESQLKIKAGGTTSDNKFTLETVNCVGACALGPIIISDGHYFANVSRSNVKDIIEKTLRGLDSKDSREKPPIFPLEVRCPRCNHSLMDPDHPIDGHPAVRLVISFDQKYGWVRLSSLYGSFNFESEHEVPLNTVVNFFCPHCSVELGSAWNCSECGAPMIPMLVRGGGIVQICARRGCKSHMLDLNGVNA